MAQISEVKIWPVKGNKVVKANGSFTINDAISIKCSVMEGTKGLWIGLPGKYAEVKNDEGQMVRKKDENGKDIWYSDVFVKSKDLYKSIQDTVLAAYNKETGNTQGTKDTVGDDGIPW